jgi:dephospho-CoA kinase
MKLPLQIGITGGIGSGKSLICKIFQTLGAPVYDADSRAKNLMTTDGILIEQIQKEFGNLAYYSDGALNRKHIGEQAFKDPKKLEKLNGLIHPRVAIDYARWMKEQTKPYVLKEAALLFEAGSYRELDKIIVVTAPEELKVKRVLKRDAGRTEEGIRDIMKNQMPELDKIQKADFLIVNDENTLVIPQVLELHQRFIS